MKWHLIPLNPVDGVDAPHVGEKEQEFLTPDEAERVTAALEGTPYELPILVGLYGGLRPAEYLGLRWRDVDLDASEVRVLRNVQPDPAGPGDSPHGC